MPNANTLDSPKVGVWPDGYYMSDHEFDPDGIFFMGASFFAFEREKMLSGDPDASYVYFGSCPEQRNCKVAGSLPSDLDGFIPPPTGAPNVFALFTADEYDDPQGDGLRLFDFHVDFEIPSNSSFTERNGSPAPVQPFSPLVQRIQQPGGAPALETIADRLMYRLSYRHFSDGKESLVVNHTIVGATAGLAAVRYYQLDRTTPSGPFVISEQQTFAPDTASRWMASTAMNWQGDTALGYSISSGTIRPSIRYAARLSTDPPGTGLNQGEQTVINGAGLQTSGSRRWGTYSAMSVDPSDDCSFWYTQEYYPATASNGWHTRIAKFAPAPCSPSPRGVIQGTITSCATGLPINGVAVAATRGFNRVTDANGAYSMVVSPGTYDIRPHHEGYAANAAVGVLVSPDAVVTENFCMAPVVTMKAGVPNVESGNHLLEPSECNLVTIPLINDGAIPASLVSATLSTTTPGVTISPATSSYADIPSSGGVRSNDSVFQVSTDSSVACLSEADFALNVSYLGAGPKVFHFKLPVGRPEGKDYIYTPSNGGTLTTTGTLVPGTQTSSGGSITAPFGFSVYGKPVNAGDTLIVGTSGVLKVAPVGGGPTSFNSPLPHVGFENRPVLFPYWDDIDMDWERTGQQGGIYVETAGNSPHRTFKVEFRGGRYPNGFIGPININFAIIFHENSDLFEYVYVQTGTTVDPNGGSSTVGSQSGNYFPFYTQYSYNSPVITQGLVLSATHPPAVCSAGGGGCAAPTSFYVTGRVLSSQGRLLRGNLVTATGPALQTPITTRTDSHGIYRFPTLPANGTYTISVSNRRYSIPSQIVNLNDNKVNVDFVTVP